MYWRTQAQIFSPNTWMASVNILRNIRLQGVDTAVEYSSSVWLRRWYRDILNLRNFNVCFTLIFTVRRWTRLQTFMIRKVNLSSIITSSTMNPLLLLVIDISYRYIKRKNSYSLVEEKEIYGAELKQQRKRIYYKTRRTLLEKKIGVMKYSGLFWNENLIKR